MKKVRTGSGLPAGPAGVIGAAEGLSFLVVLGGIVVEKADYMMRWKSLEGGIRLQTQTKPYQRRFVSRRGAT